MLLDILIIILASLSAFCIFMLIRIDKVYKIRMQRLGYAQSFIDKLELDKSAQLLQEFENISYEKMLLKFWVPVDEFFNLKF